MDKNLNKKQNKTNGKYLKKLLSVIDSLAWLLLNWSSNALHLFCLAFRFAFADFSPLCVPFGPVADSLYHRFRLFEY